MAGRLAGPAGQAGPGPAPVVTAINPADAAAIPFSVNPLAPEPGYSVQAHVDMVRALFLAAFDADEPFPQIMSQSFGKIEHKRYRLRKHPFQGSQGVAGHDSAGNGQGHGAHPP